MVTVGRLTRSPRIKRFTPRNKRGAHPRHQQRNMNNIRPPYKNSAPRPVRRRVNSRPRSLFQIVVRFQRFKIPLRPTVIRSPTYVSHSIRRQLITITNRHIPGHQRQTPGVIRRTIRRRTSTPTATYVSRPIRHNIVTRPEVSTVMISHIMPINLKHRRQPRR